MGTAMGMGIWRVKILVPVPVPMAVPMQNTRVYPYPCNTLVTSEVTSSFKILFRGSQVACMSGNMCIMILLHDSMPQMSVFGDINIASEHE
jgi:hypothetical protein